MRNAKTGNEACILPKKNQISLSFLPWLQIAMRSFSILAGSHAQSFRYGNIVSVQVEYSGGSGS
jgi:hypothetical protein